MLTLIVPLLLNDGGLNSGGTPKLLSEHPSVVMKKEKIKLLVTEHSTQADCTFWFYNEGQTCRVRLGFPDEASSSEDPEEEGELKKPKGSLLGFKSYVDGKLTATKVERGDGVSGHFYWHTKTVSFPGETTTVVRDTYSSGGGGITERGSYIRQSSYIVHTGSSWHGKIGVTEIEVTFAIPAMGNKLMAKSTSSFKKKPWEDGFPPIPANTVIYSGMNKPKVVGNKLIFTRSNWRPSAADDLTLYYREVKGASG